jgi:two-component system chemotaxis response regulator CheY
MERLNSLSENWDRILRDCDSAEKSLNINRRSTCRPEALSMFDPKTRILVVDDMMTMRKLVSKVCREIGFTDISEAADGAKAWEAIQAATPPFGLVISDWNMPNVTGLDLLKKVRSDGRFSKIPFMMVTAEAETDQIVEAVKAGVNNYVVKPFTAETFTEKLETVHKRIIGKA